MLQLEEKGFITGNIVKEGKMPEKVIYSLTDSGEQQFEKLMMEIASKPIQIFLDFNAVIVNLDSIPSEKQIKCLTDIENNIKILKGYIEENIRIKENLPEIPKTGMDVLQQQYHPYIVVFQEVLLFYYQYMMLLPLQLQHCQ